MPQELIPEVYVVRLTIHRDPSESVEHVLRTIHDAIDLDLYGRGLPMESAIADFEITHDRTAQNRSKSTGGGE